MPRSCRSTTPDPAKRIWGGEAGPTYWWTDLPDFLGSDLKTVVGALDDDTTIRTWDVLAGLVRDGYALTDDMVVSMGASSLLATGQQGMSFEDNFAIGDLLEQGVNLGVAPLPVESSGQPAFVPSWTDAWSTFTASAHPDQALDFITFMATEGNVLREAGGAYPLDQQVAKDADYGADSPAKQQMVDVMGLTRTRPVRARLVHRVRPVGGHVPPGDRERRCRLGPARDRPRHPGRPGARMGDVGQPVVAIGRFTPR